MDATPLTSLALDKPAIRYGRRKLLLLLLIGFAPMVTAWLLYLGEWRPQTMTAHGELIIPAQPQEQWLPSVEARAALEPLRGHWVIVEILPTPCAQNCLQRTHELTQLHLALGKEAERVRRLWIGDSTPTNPLLNLSSDPYLQVLPTTPLQIPDQRTRFIVDPLGNLVLTYRPDQDVRLLLKDLKRLLKASSIG